MVVIAVAVASEPVEVVVEAPERVAEDRATASVSTVPIDGRVPEADDLAELVGRAPGVVVTRLGGPGDLATASVRGSTGRQVEISVDGVPLNPDGASAVDLAELPMRAFGAVEVWRGARPGGLAGAMGGAIALWTAQGEPTSLAATAGTLGTSALRGSLRRAFEGGDVFVSARVFATEGDFAWFDDAGTRFEPGDDVWRRRGNNDARSGSALARVRWTSGSWTFAFLDLAVVREEGVPGFTSAPRRAVRYGARQNLAVAQAERAGAAPFVARAWVRARADDLEDRLGELGAEGRQAEARSGGAGVDAGLGAPLGSVGRLDLGAAAREDRFGPPRAPLARQVATGRASLSAWGRGGLHGELGLVAVALRNAAGGDGAWLPSLGGAWSPREGWRARARVARSFRPPDPTELYGNSGALVGDPDLRPERGWSADVGLRRTDGWGSAEIAAFHTESVDLVTWVQNAQQVAIATNIGRARASGVEGSLELAAGGLDSRTNLTVQRTENLSDLPAHRGRPLPRQPALVVSQETAWVADRWRVGLQSTVASAFATDQAGLSRQGARLLHDLTGRVELGGGFSLELDLRNALGTRVGSLPANPLDPGGPRAPTALADVVGYPLPGRTFTCTLAFDG